MKTLFSWAVWKQPCPNFEVVSMNLSSIFSRARRLWCTRRDWDRGRGDPQDRGPHPQATPSLLTHLLPESLPFLLSPSPTYLLSVPTPPTFHGAPAPQLPSPPQVLTFLSVMTRFLVPAMQPFSMTKSLLTSP